MRTFGVEEELLLVDAVTGLPRPVAPAALHAARERTLPAPAAGVTFEAEMQEEMIEVVGSPQLELSALLAQIRAGRAHADAAAQTAGARALAVGASPLAASPHPTAKKRYDTMMDTYGATANRSLSCGLHTHVSIGSREEGVAVLDRIRVWLPVLVALSANSPFENGIDTGHASFRSMAWRMWPCSGPNDVFGSVAAYDDFESRMLGTGTLLDSGMLYFDARLSRNHPTVEIRVADVCLSAEDAAVLAALCRGLVERAADDWRAGVPAPAVPTALVRLASWKSALCGVSAKLVHPLTGLPREADEVVGTLLTYAAPGMERSDAATVANGLARILSRGSGADIQREAVAETGDLATMVLRAVELSVGASAYTSA